MGMNTILLAIDWSSLWTQVPWLLDLFISVVLGFIIGLERKLRFKEAGVRTHTIVCFGACLMMVVSLHAFGSDADAARVAAQIVSGIGFLGAGMIVYRQHEVHGLTTAAGVWTTAGIGMAVGGRLYVIAIGATLLLICAQCLLHIPFFRGKKSYSIKIQFLYTENENMKIKKLFGVDRFNQLVITREGNTVVYSATLSTEQEFSSTWINQVMVENPFICSIERCDNE